jgi:hypothetical protein
METKIKFYEGTEGGNIMGKVIENMKSDLLFSLGKHAGDKLRKDKSVEMACQIIELMEKLNSTAFLDGVFSEGDIYYGSGVHYNVLNDSKFSRVEYETNTGANEGYRDIEHWYLTRPKR